MLVSYMMCVCTLLVCFCVAWWVVCSSAGWCASDAAFFCQALCTSICSCCCAQLRSQPAASDRSKPSRAQNVASIANSKHCGATLAARSTQHSRAGAAADKAGDTSAARGRHVCCRCWRIKHATIDAAELEYILAESHALRPDRERQQNKSSRF